MVLDEWRGRLRPTRPGQPWLAIVHSYDARGRIDARVLHALLDVKFDLTVALDIQTLPRHRAMRAAELAYATARVIRRDATVKDVGADRKFVDAERVMHALQDQQALHDVQVAALVSGESVTELEAHVAEVIRRMGSALKLTRVAGAQEPWLRLFGATPARQMGEAIGDLTAAHVDYLSHATTGTCVAVFGNTVYAMSVQANALEQHMLRGS